MTVVEHSKHRGKINPCMALMWRAWFIKLPPQANVIKSRLVLDVGFVALPRNLPQGDFTYLKHLKKSNRLANTTFSDCNGDTKVIQMSWSYVGIGEARKHRTSKYRDVVSLQRFCLTEGCVRDGLLPQVRHSPLSGFPLSLSSKKKLEGNILEFI